MTENEQIEEMARVLDECCNRIDEHGNHLGNRCYECEYWSETNHVCCSYNRKEATYLYNAGYRKVERGHWISREEVDVFDSYDLVDACSVCGHCDWDCTESQSFNFCPNCGADMRGEEDD